MANSKLPQNLFDSEFQSIFDAMKTIRSRNMSNALDDPVRMKNMMADLTPDLSPARMRMLADLSDIGYYQMIVGKSFSSDKDIARSAVDRLVTDYGYDRDLCEKTVYVVSTAFGMKLDLPTSSPSEPESAPELIPKSAPKPIPKSASETVPESSLELESAPIYHRESINNNPTSQYVSYKKVEQKAQKFIYPTFGFGRCFLVNLLAALTTILLEVVNILPFSGGGIPGWLPSSALMPGMFLLVFALTYALVIRTKYGGLTEADGEARILRGFFLWIHVVTFVILLVAELIYRDTLAGLDLSVSLVKTRICHLVCLIIGIILIGRVPSVTCAQKDAEERKRSPYFTPEASSFHESRIKTIGIWSMICSVSVFFSFISIILYYKCKAHHAFFAMSKRNVPDAADKGMKLTKIAFIISVVLIGLWIVCCLLIIRSAQLQLS